MKIRNHENNRRAFIKNLGIRSIASFALPVATFDNYSVNEKSGLSVLFQGDYITDGNRTSNNDWNHVMGHGFQFIIASKLCYENPKSNLMFFNWGVGGNTVTDLENRWQEDALYLKPDLISILIGVNDSMAVVNNQNPQSIEIFQTSYRNILQNSKSHQPNIKFIICEPFILENGWVSKNTDLWKTKIKNVKKLLRH